MLARISSALFVHTKGLGSSLRTSINSQIARSSSLTLRWAPRRICFVVSSPNQRSTRFNHEPYVGVKWTWNRGRFANQVGLSGVLWVPLLSVIGWILGWYGR